ncbi:LOW QUALITY PROTEIN: Serine protease trypsin-like protein [Phytophthora megakarya]|uniref:Serine protease trypsin-like protein n=1 Tax=Phytophthora megakarya TaxID=4795 RepID=A0A225V5Q5_9STRA|nr:LOW QUALITY PROTEIN: Serine protease trypsin-like protein [Phytophthora megakarya]
MGHKTLHRCVHRAVLSISCAGGVLNKGTVFGDIGDPIISEMEEGDTNDALIGICNEADGCGPDCLNVFSRVITVLPRINSIINGK